MVDVPNSIFSVVNTLVTILNWLRFTWFWKAIITFSTPLIIAKIIEIITDVVFIVRIRINEKAKYFKFNYLRFIIKKSYTRGQTALQSIVQSKKVLQF